MIILSQQQRDCVAAIEAFLLDDKRQTFSVHGHAGTGNTNVLSHVATEHPEARPCAFTGKAAYNVQTKTGMTASTVHAIFYQLTYQGIHEKTGKQVLYWKQSNISGGLKRAVILLDESSMIDVYMAHDLLDSGAKIITFGDNGQLAPVAGKTAFVKTDFALTEIHRQAALSPIIRQATNVRTTGKYADDTDDFKIVSKFTDEDLLSADMILCWTNKTRHALNARMRSLHGLSGLAKAGEPIVCLANQRSLNLYNGAVYTLAADYNPFLHGVTNGSVSVEVDGKIIDVPKSAMVTPGKEIKDYPLLNTAFDYAYCLTTHKSQGSEWKRVAVVDEYFKRGVDRNRWVYTALTRASDSVIIQR